MHVNVSKNSLSENVNRRNWYLTVNLDVAHSFSHCVSVYLCECVCARVRIYIYIRIHVYVCSSYTVKEELHPKVLSFLGGRGGGG
jgi:hypothetical protein